jgi:hypothetical protein
LVAGAICLVLNCLLFFVLFILGWRFAPLQQ